MSLTLRKDVARRLHRPSGRRGHPSSALFGRSVQLLDAAEDLAYTATEPADARALDASLDCMAPALEALATATLQLGLVARGLVGDDEAERGRRDPAAGNSQPARQATRLLFAASQNLRIAAQAAKQAQGSITPGQLPARS
jgi:hypothetical protein